MTDVRPEEKTEPVQLIVNAVVEKEWWDPLNRYAWKTTVPIGRDRVEQMIQDGLFEAPSDKPTLIDVYYETNDEEGWLNYHARRIAWLVKNWNEDAMEPIEVDFGIPGTCAKFVVCDGNHRLAAAIYMGLTTIKARWSGVFNEDLVLSTTTM